MTSASASAPISRVLFVTDDDSLSNQAVKGLALAAMNVTVANNGEEALAALEHGEIDLLVADLSNTEQSNFATLERVRAKTELRDLPIIAIATLVDEETVRRAFASGATLFLAKPLNWPLFVHHARYVLQAARTHSDLRRATRTAEFMNDLKSRLIGTLVTEFQTPLRAAFGFARLINEKADGPLSSQLYTEWVGELHRSLERLSTVHLKMLNFGRSVSDQIDLQEENIKVGAWLGSLQDQFFDAARRRNIVITCENRLPETLQLRGDGVLFANAVQSILDNAVKFSPRGTNVVIRASRTADATMSLTINDGVQTLSQVQIDEIMGRKQFASVRPETVDLSSGLKMSRILIEAHQGTMTIRAGADGLVTELLLPAARLIDTTKPLPKVAEQPVPANVVDASNTLSQGDSRPLTAHRLSSPTVNANPASPRLTLLRQTA